MHRKLRIGLVGCGGRGTSVAGLFHSHPDCEVVALVDRYLAPARQAAEKLDLKDARVEADFAKVLREEAVDAFYFACPPTEQVALACEAMDAGRHACTDVPAAFSIAECERLIHTVEKTGCKYQLMEQTRYWGFIESWRDMHARGEFGHICMAQGEYIHYERRWNYWVHARTGEFSYEPERPEDPAFQPAWRYHVLGEPIYYLPHTLSPLLKILKDRVVSVSCMGTRKKSYTYPEADLEFTDIQYALMHTAGDTVLLVGAGFSMPYIRRGAAGCHWYELRGTQASVESPRCKDDPFRVWKPGMDSYGKMDLGTTPIDASEAQAKSGHGGADFKPVDSFVRAILDDTPPPMDVYTTVEMTAPAILAAESARRGGLLIEVPDFRNT